MSERFLIVAIVVVLLGLNIIVSVGANSVRTCSKQALEQLQDSHYSAEEVVKIVQEVCR